MIEFNRWYTPGGAVYRCLWCGCMVTEGDREVHAKWHESLFEKGEGETP